METLTQPLTATFDVSNGQKVFYRHWKSAGSPKAVVVIVHGFNSHSGYYQWTADQLVDSGYETYALDLRGRGNSDGERFYIADMNEFVDDVDQLVSVVKAAQPDLPVFVLGHSAGGVLSCLYMLAHQDRVNGFICESFAYQVPAPDFAIAVLKGLSHLAPHAHVLKLKNEDFSRDAAVVEAMNNDPLIAHEVQPTRTVQQLAVADERLKKEFSTIQIPLFIIHGSEDKATRPSGSEFFYKQASSTDKTLKIYEGHYHDMLNDLDKEVVMGDILDWLNQRA
ncbi:alpha/beta hydrolase [Chryseolinea soli]|uniref:Monoacylglycerol lipase n=1 Tax=Chryseolinea soli TaxID=2321403 RepID=A0A385SKM7_9BACT|nr:alpha/beta hydrolase [Chryseolinea soli]AYB30911.1 lysophospholipase [Chryseolinea soli]